MNPARALLHLFSPLGGEGADNYRAPGQISFLRAPFVPAESDELKASGAKYAFIGVPFDEGNVGKPGSGDGPREFRVASLDYFPYWFEFNVDLHGTALDCGDVQMPRVNPEVARERIYAAVRAVLAAGKTPIICGGDRSISIPAARALSDHLGASKKMGYMHLGAHLDFADSWAGESHLSTCAMARITELENIDLAKARGIRFHPMFEVLERGVDAVMDETVARVWDGTDGQYLSFNFNVMDSSSAPGVTATEPGGLEAREIIRVAAKIAARGGLSVIDVTELCPMYDISGQTSRMAVCVVLRIMAGIARTHGETLDESVRRPGWTHNTKER